MSCFLVTAWEAFAAQESKTIWQMPVEFMHIEVLQPVRAERTEKVKLSVLFDFSSKFQACPASCSNGVGSLPSPTTSLLP